MKVIDQGHAAQSITKFKALKFKQPLRFIRMKKRDKFLLNSIPVGMSGLYRADEYTKAELTDLRCRCARYNRSLPLQFYICKHKNGDHEVARIA